MYSQILGTGSALPDKVLTNADLEKMVDTSDEWIRERTGIKERRVVAAGQTTSDLALIAANKAIAAAGIAANTIDMIIVATCTPDKFFPSTACILQHKLGLKDFAAFDINAVCSGFSYALTVADQHIKTGFAKTILVVGAESLSRIIDWTDRSTCVLFGDGAGAIILTASDEPGIYSTHLHADGAYGPCLQAPLPYADIDEEASVHMNGREVFKKAVTELEGMVEETLSANNMSADQIDWLIPHQANLRIINSVAKKLSMPMDKVIVTVDVHGNTSAASIPLALDAGIQAGKIKRGDTLLLESFGAGFTWGSAIVRY